MNNKVIEILKSLKALPWTTSSLNGEDPFECHLFLTGTVICYKCKNELIIHSAADKKTDEYLKDAATQSKAAGWSVVLDSDDFPKLQCSFCTENSSRQP